MPELHYDPITSVNVSNCGNYILTNSLDSRMCLVDTRMFEAVTYFEDFDYTNSSNSNVATVSGASQYAIVGSKNGTLLAFDINR